MSGRPKGTAKYTVLRVLSILLGIAALAGCVVLMILDRPGDIKVHFIDVGQGDAILITSGKEAMLIDAGSNDYAGEVQSYLSRQGVSKLKYVVATHPDGDHIGGLDTIIERIDVTSAEVWMPDVDYNAKTFRDLIDAIEYCDYKRVCPEGGSEYKLGKATVTVLSPGKTYDDNNDNCMVIKVAMGENSFLFAGDITTEAEKDLINKYDPEILKAGVLKVSNNGANTSTSSAFLRAVSPKAAVITVSAENTDGVPTADVLNKLKTADISVYRTDEMGTIVVTGNEVDYNWNKYPSITWAVGGNKIGE